MKKSKIAVLIPCYNEAKTIEKVIFDHMEALPEADIFVYDNNSKDDTDKIAKNSGAIVRYEYKQGKGNVIRSMFRDIDADCYYMIDGDDTYPANHAREMCDLILSKKADMVVGDRLSSTYFTENKRIFHNFGNVLVRFLVNKLFNNEVKDIMTGQRAFSKSFVKGFPIVSKGFEIETEMTIHASRKNYKVLSIEVNYRDRQKGSESKLNTFKDGFKILATILKLTKECRPILFYGLISLLFMIISLVLIIININLLKVNANHYFIFFTLLLSVTSFLIGIILSHINKIDRKNYELLMNIVYQESQDNEKNEENF